MKKRQSKLKLVLARILAFSIFTGVVILAIRYRGFPLHIGDITWFLLGFVSMLWILYWMKKGGYKKQSLIVPYAPMFLAFTLLIVGNSLDLISDSGVFTIIAFYLYGYFVGAIMIDKEMQMFGNKQK